MPRWLKIILGLVVAIALAVFTLPWWLGLVARPLAKAAHVTFGDYQRVRYGRFRVTDIRVEQRSVIVTARSAESQTPLFWLWHRLRGPAPEIEVAGWKVEKVAHPRPSPSKKKSKWPQVTGLPTLHEVLVRVARGLQYCLPHAHLTDGIVDWRKGRLTLAEAEWKKDTLTFRGLELYGRTLDGTIFTGPLPTLSADAIDTASGLHAKLDWSGAPIAGLADLWEQSAPVHASFPAVGWLPTEAAAELKDWNVDAARLHLGSHYGTVSLAGAVTLHAANYTFHLSAAAHPLPDTKAPKFEVQAEAAGDPRSVTLRELHVDTPFAQAALTAPVTLDFHGTATQAPARLSLAADLEKQTWFKARGKIRGHLVSTGAGQDSRQTFELEAEDLHLGEFAARSARAAGRLQWPKLTVETFDVSFDDRNRAAATGAADLAAQNFTGVRLSAHLASSWLDRWLPDSVSWENVSLDAALDGPWHAAAHHGTATFTGARVRGLKPFSLAADWRGTGPSLDDVRIHAAAGTSALQLAGTLHAGRAELRELQLGPATAPLLHLTAPALLQWQPRATATLALAGADNRKLSLQTGGGTDDAFVIEAVNLPSELLAEWIDLSGPRWRVQAWRAEGNFGGGSLAFTTRLQGEILLENRRTQVSLNASGDAHGVDLQELKVSENGTTLTSAQGHLPLSWRPHTAPHLFIDDSAKLELTAETGADSPLWSLLAGQAGVTLAQSEAKARLHGTLREPAGELQIRIARLVPFGDALRNRLPELQNLELEARAARHAITLEKFSAEVEGQPLRAAARLPMDDGRWQALWRAPRSFDWRALEGKLDIPEANLGEVAARLPRFALSQGKLQANLVFHEGQLTGDLHLREATSRPLPFGVAQEINADLHFTGPRLEIQTFTGKLGGEPVTVQGAIELENKNAVRLNVSLKGNNIPLVRRAGILVRSNLDLQATTDDEGRTTVSGAVTLRDSFVLADLASLLPSGPRGVKRQPPYFSVEVEPLADWHLAVEVRGQQAVKIRTPVFRGLASARFQLSGTLRDPRAVGEISVDQAQVLFPFATFNVELGVVRLSAADPYHPQLTLNAVSRRQNYQLRLEATGAPESPNVVLSSNPPLEAAQVLLMVTTGQPPTEEVGPNGVTAQGGQRLTLLGAYLGRGLFGTVSGDENRLEIVSGEQISRSGRETYQIEYKLDKRRSLTGEYDEFDEYNAGVKWRAYTQESKPREELKPDER